jgi:hypothetical protein
MDKILILILEKLDLLLFINEMVIRQSATLFRKILNINWKYGVTRFSDDHSMCFSILRVPTHVTPCECYDRMWGAVGFFFPILTIFHNEIR